MEIPDSDSLEGEWLCVGKTIPVQACARDEDRKEPPAPRKVSTHIECAPSSPR
jgi:hypothetical protein